MAKAKGKKITIEEALVPVEEQPYDIPENWCWTFLKAVCVFENGYAFKSDKFGKEGIPVIRISNIQENEVDVDTCVYTSETDIEERFIVKKGDLLIAMSGATTGKNGIYTFDKRAYLNQRVGNIKVKSERVLFPRLRDYYIMSKQEEILNSAYGGAQPNISSTKIGEMLFPLPPLAEQKRIVEKIGKLFAKLDEAKEKALTVVESFELSKKAIYKKAFEGSLTNSWRAENGINISDWEEIPFEKLGKLERGRSKHRPRNDERLFGGEYPFIQTGDVAGAGMYVTSHKQTLSEFGFEQSRMFPQGTLCITIAANIGDAAILSYDCCFPDSVVGFTPGEKCFNKYMYFYLQEIKAELEYIAPATAQKNLNLKLLGEVEIKVPSLKEQEKIVEILEKQINYQESIVEKAENVIETIDMMKKSILAKAFRGELGTNVESEESAIELLKSIL